jgi:hypothetical protein
MAMTHSSPITEHFRGLDPPALSGADNGAVENALFLSIGHLACSSNFLSIGRLACSSKLFRAIRGANPSGCAVRFPACMRRRT